MSMMALGDFVFALQTIPFTEVARNRTWRQVSNDVIGRIPPSQYIGQGEDNISLQCTLYPELTGGKVEITKLSTMADAGKSYVLVDGGGYIWGTFVITSMNETYKEFFADGAARQIDWSMELKRTDSNQVDSVGSIDKRSSS